MKKSIVTFLLLFISVSVFSQEEDAGEKEKALRTSTNLTWDGNKNLSENNFVQAEVDYRKAIAKSPENVAAPYNLGTAYYNNETYSEAFGRFKEAGEVATSKQEKHKAYHNMGNVFMKRKDYPKAVEAYKEALRNDPTDDETRYNLALAKEMQKKEEEENKDKNDDNKDQQDQEDKKDQNQDKDKEGDNKEDQNQDNKDQGEDGNEGDKGDEKKDENKEGDGDKKEEQKKKPEQGDQSDEQQRKPNQLSKQQVENLLRAMQNAEKQVQEKIDAKKVKGAKVKNEKDW